MNLYKGIEDPIEHLTRCEKTWTILNIDQLVWPHRFEHTLAMIPKSWYVQQEVRRQTKN